VEGNALTQSDADMLSNMELSIIRADEIVEFLINKNQISPNLLRSIGFGNMMPFYDNVSYKGHMDKRIDFVIFNYETER
jgi:flagellar motor protein MotB